MGPWHSWVYGLVGRVQGPLRAGTHVSQHSTSRQWYGTRPPGVAWHVAEGAWLPQWITVALSISLGRPCTRTSSRHRHFLCTRLWFARGPVVYICLLNACQHRADVHARTRAARAAGTHVNLAGVHGCIHTHAHAHASTGAHAYIAVAFAFLHLLPVTKGVQLLL